MSTISAETSAEIAAEAVRSPGCHATCALRSSGNPSKWWSRATSRSSSRGPRPSYSTQLEPRPCVRQVGPNLFSYTVGDGEKARIVKLALNLIIGGTTQLLAEALVLGERNGLERAKLLDVIGGSAIGSPYVKYKQGTLLSGDYTSTFTVNAAARRTYWAGARGRSMQPRCRCPSPRSCSELVEGCIAQGWGDLDMAVLVPHARAHCGHPAPHPSVHAIT